MENKPKKLDDLWTRWVLVVTAFNDDIGASI